MASVKRNTWRRIFVLRRRSRWRYVVGRIVVQDIAQSVSESITAELRCCARHAGVFAGISLPKGHLEWNTAFVAGAGIPAGELRIASGVAVHLVYRVGPGRPFSNQSNCGITPMAATMKEMQYNRKTLHVL